MEPQTCSNCDAPLTGKFCSSCGAPAETQKITGRRLLQHELAYGVWNMDNKIMFLLKGLFTRPGKSAKDYLTGKRAKYYNVFYLLVIVVGLTLTVTHFVEDYRNIDLSQVPKGLLKLINFARENAKYITLAQIPFIAFNSWLLFRKLKFNFAEHLIIAGFALLGMTIIGLLLNSVMLLFYATGLGGISFILTPLYFANFLFFVWLYCEVARPIYSISKVVWKMIWFFLLFVVETILISAILIYVFVF